MASPVPPVPPPTPAGPSLARLVLTFVGFVIVGAAMVGYLWEIVNELLAGHVSAKHLAIAVPLLLLFLWLLVRLRNTIGRIDQPSDPSAPSPSTHQNN